MKKNKFGTKNALFGSLDGILKNYCHICNQCPPNCLIAKFHAKIRTLKFGTKKCLIWVFLWKTIIIYEISTLECALLQSFVQKIKILKFGIKNVRFLYFGAGIWKYYFYIWNQRTLICLVAKFGTKRKSLNLGPKMPDLYTFGLEFGNNFVIFEISNFEFV